MGRAWKWSLAWRRPSRRHSCHQCPLYWVRISFGLHPLLFGRAEMKSWYFFWVFSNSESLSWDPFWVVLGSIGDDVE